MPIARRATALAAVIAAAALALTGCNLLPDGGGGETDAPADLSRFYEQQLDWTEDGDGTDTAMMTVPLDWDDPAGETIEIALGRHHASGGEPLGSMLLNPGGPGGSGYEYVHDYWQYVFTPGVLENYDVVGFDPRGVGLSTPVVCYDDPADRDQHLYGTYDAAYGTDEWAVELAEREKAYAAACQENTGPLLEHIDAASVARDMDLMRALLGDDTINYIGYSYGTYLGTVYAELFPDKVGRMVLDGAIDPQVGDLEALSTQMGGFDSALKAYVTDCIANDSSCPFTGTPEEGLAQIREITGSVDGKGLTSSDGRVLDSATVGTGIADYLYAEAYWPDLTAAFNDLFDGSAEGMFAAADDYNGRNPDGTYLDNSGDVYNAVTCAEGTLGVDGVSTVDSIASLKEAAPVMGDYLGYDDTAVLDALCSNWPYEVADLPDEFDAEGAPPILVIGTSNDPATPYANAVSLAKQLSSGVLISYEGEGHTIYAQGVSCVDDVVDAFLIEGTVPDADPMC